jgi:molecular chaperone DnaK
MEPILGIDLGTTNSVVAILQDGKPVVLPVEQGRKTLPSAVGLDSAGERLVGTPARNQAILAPERTVLSVKRKMGEDVKLTIGGQELAPQEISAVILRTLKERAEAELNRPIQQAVITVPAFFNEKQRAATKHAGELAGLEVLRIINEPTAAALIYEPHSEERERLLVYDLGGGTFDVSIVQIELGVVEVLSSHGDTHLGGDDFDKLLLDHICERFRKEEVDVDLRANPAARSRLLQAVEAAKCRLSDEAYTTIEEAFLAEHNGKPLNLSMTIDRLEYEELIQPLLQKTIDNVDATLADAKMLAKDIDKVILVGGSSRTPLLQDMLAEQLGQAPRAVFDPDLCVALGAAVQGGLIAGEEVGPVLVDITPHTLGVRCIGMVNGMETDRCFSRLIKRNNSLPATRSELFYTTVPGQEAVQLDVYQGEHDDTNFNEMIGSFTLEGLDESADSESEILVRFDLDLNGTLTVTAVERATALEKQLTIDNAITRFRAKSTAEAKQRLAAAFGFQDRDDDTTSASEIPAEIPASLRHRFQRATGLLSKADRLAADAADDDAEEIRQLCQQLKTGLEQQSEEKLDELNDKLEDVLFYLEDA